MVRPLVEINRMGLPVESDDSGPFGDNTEWDLSSL